MRVQNCLASTKQAILNKLVFTTNRWKYIYPSEREKKRPWLNGVENSFIFRARGELFTFPYFKL
jgi:hypothetical protein